MGFQFFRTKYQLVREVCVYVYTHIYIGSIVTLFILLSLICEKRKKKNPFFNIELTQPGHTRPRHFTDSTGEYRWAYLAQSAADAD